MHPVIHGMKNSVLEDELYSCLTGDHPIEIVAQAKSKVDRKYFSIFP
jgi:hypothetical protein